LLLTILSGGVCGLAAVCFHVGIGKAENLVINRALAAPFPTWIYLAILVPAVGGLLVGLALHYWVPGAVGSGIPQVKVAYALHAGHVAFRDAVGKFVLGIVQIGSGGSLGREGPTVQICAGISSLLARAFSFHVKTNAEWLRWASQPGLPLRSMRPSPLSPSLWKRSSATWTKRCFPA
jgi:CIC family chloride channel protein